VDAQCSLVAKGETCQVENGKPFGQCLAKMPCEPPCEKGQQCFEGVCGAPKEGCNVTSQANCSAMNITLASSSADHAWLTVSFTQSMSMALALVAMVAYVF